MILLTVVFQNALLDAAAAVSRPIFEIIMDAIMPVAQKAVIATASLRAFILKHAVLFAAAWLGLAIALVYANAQLG